MFSDAHLPVGSWKYMLRAWERTKKGSTRRGVFFVFDSAAGEKDQKRPHLDVIHFRAVRRNETIIPV